MQDPLCLLRLDPCAVDACGRSALPPSQAVSFVLRRFVGLLEYHPGCWFCPEVHKDWVVRALVLLVEAQLVDGENVDPMLVDEPLETATGHTQKSGAVGVVTMRDRTSNRSLTPQFRR